MATTDPLAAVHQYIHDFNKGDGEAMAATFAVTGSILRRHGATRLAGTDSRSGLVPRCAA